MHNSTNEYVHFGLFIIVIKVDIVEYDTYSLFAFGLEDVQTSATFRVRFRI